MIKEIIIIYLGINCLFLSYVRLRDTKKLYKVYPIMRPIFIIYIGIMTTPLILFQWLKKPYKNTKIKNIKIYKVK